MLPLVFGLIFASFQAEVVLVADGVEVANGLPRNTCTCFMYFDLTPNAIRLAQLWAQNIVDIDAPDDQVRSDTTNVR